MVKTNGASGSSKKDAIVITGADTQKEGYLYVCSLAQKYLEEGKYDHYHIDDDMENEVHSGHAIVTFSWGEWVKDFLWIDISYLYGKPSGWNDESGRT